MSLEVFRALHDFRACWSSLDEGDVSRTGRFTVPAKVAFHSPNGSEFDRTRVTVLFDGYEQGRIDIEETSDLTIDKFHLQFSPDWQDFLFDTDSDSLLVEGSSEKMGGEYQVRIHPIGNKNAED